MNTLTIRLRYMPAVLLTAVLSGCASVPQLPQAQADVGCDALVGQITGQSVASPATTPSESAASAGTGLKIETPEIDDVVSRLGRRHQEIHEAVVSGTVGYAVDGYLALHDTEGLPIEKRTALRKLIANDNADRAALYHAIAVSNDQPEWETPIRLACARSWIDLGPEHAWYLDRDGNWQQR